MSKRRLIPIIVAAILGTGAAVLPHYGTSATAAPTTKLIGTAHSCSTAPAPGYATCHAIRRTDVSGPVARPDVASPNIAGYGPSVIRSAYRLPSNTRGAGRTIAIVDAFDDPRAESDLAVYRSQFGLPACTTANGCFRKVNQNGVQGSYPAPHAGWAQEVSLDLDMASAVCPLCHILLVEANSSRFSSLETAVRKAGALGATDISLSWGSSQTDRPDATNSPYHQAGRPIVVSSGDSGFGVQYPAASRWVISVGGTRLTADSSPRGWTERAWSGAGSGCSGSNPNVAPTTFDTGCPNRRAFTDLSAVADPGTGVSVYDSFHDLGWLVFGGTSASAPIIAAALTLLVNPSFAASPQAVYAIGKGAFFDVTTGANGNCSAQQLCHARAGWDGPTGRGTPNFAFTP